MPNYRIISKYAEFENISKKHNVSECIARLLVNRGITSDEEIDIFLNGNINDLPDPYKLDCVQEGIDLILDCIKNKKKIRVIGDYDVDGVCSTYIMVHALELLGACISFDIPHRIIDGYGLNERLVKKCIEDKVDLIITVDNGIAAVEEINLAIKNGIKVIVTDHHQPQEVLPKCNIIINPHMKNDKSAFKDICGTFVAFKLIQALYRACNIKKTEEEKLLNFVALATVGDSMPLIKENRIVVKYGLSHIAESDNIGIQSLIKVQEIKEKKIKTYHIGFIINPCINASGRLDSAKKSLELLMCKDELKAKELAFEIKKTNDLRKSMTSKFTDIVVEKYSSKKLPKVIVEYLRDCHESIAGIVAGHIKEKFNRPVIILTEADGFAKGSARSIEGYDIFEELSKLKSLFIKFGGHKMAAGLSIPYDNIDILREKLNSNCLLEDKDYEKKILIDMEYPFSYINEDAINELEIISPCGEGNPAPLFCARDVYVLHSIIRGDGKVLSLTLTKNNVKFSAVYFGETDKFLKYIEKNNKNIKIVFTLSINEFRGAKSCQITIRDFL